MSNTPMSPLRRELPNGPSQAPTIGRWIGGFLVCLMLVMYSPDLPGGLWLPWIAVAVETLLSLRWRAWRAVAWGGATGAAVLTAMVWTFFRGIA